MYKVTDRWTTQDGEWWDTGKKYSIDKTHIDKYTNEDIPQRGAATHIVAKVPSGTHVQIVNRYNNKVEKNFISVGVWFDFPMSKGAAYNPDNGETGPWNVVVDGVTVAEGIGLPLSNHVSTFLVIEDVGETEEPEESDDSGPSVPEDVFAIDFTLTQNGKKMVYSGLVKRTG